MLMTVFREMPVYHFDELVRKRWGDPSGVCLLGGSFVTPSNKQRSNMDNVPKYIDDRKVFIASQRSW